MTVRLGNVSFSYPGSTDFALDRVSAEFTPGRVHLVTGALGAGCSTLLLAAAGLAPHVTAGRRIGTVSTLGLDPADPQARPQLSGRIGLLLPTPWTQLSGMAPTVAEEVAFAPANLGWDRARIRRSVDDAMERAGVTALRDREPGTLSGGELQRVMFAAVIALQPEVYLLDEPAVQLDPAAADQLYRLLPELARDATLVIASTDVDRLAGRGDRVVLLHPGAVAADGDPDAVLGGEAALAARCAPTVAEIARDAGVGAGPWAVTTERLVRRLGA